MQSFSKNAIFLLALLTSVAMWAQTAPKIICVNPLPNGTVEINWVAQPNVGTVCVGTSQPFSQYSLYVSSSPTGTPSTLLTTIGSAADGSYIDNVSNPTAGTLYYYMTTSCGTIVSGNSLIVDTQPPVPPVITSVTVTDDTSVQISWATSVSPETNAYIIYRADDNGSFIPIDTIIASSSLGEFYLDTNAQPALQAEAYKIAGLDGCSPNPGPTSPAHQSIYLDLSSDPCNASISLDWTAYEGWANVQQYEIADLTNPGNIIQIGNLPGNTTDFTYTLPAGQSTACFRVRAVSGNAHTSQSNTLCVTVEANKGPSYMYMTNATVTNTNEVTVTWDIDTDGKIKKLNVLRGINDSSTIDHLTQYFFMDPPTATMEFVDNSGNTGRDVYVYQLEHIDSCGLKSYSSIVKTINLEASDQFNLTNLVNWTPFYITYGIVESYTLYRALADGTSPVAIATITPTDTLKYTDAGVELQDLESGGFCYYVGATYTLDLPNAEPQTLVSRSNVVCVSQAPRIFVPNAFLPNGVNNVFKPVFLNPQGDNYSMKILNRWGEIVFTTTDIDEGWDGETKGKLAPQDTYAYYITMKTNDGYLLERKGTVTLIR
ncbi:MAG: gliding motility-associated C-terminal domain-containing protein [Chitinophagales bacterium]|nr:gliding motility-associated C-terminal domain-containing protein [Chitinophagales bacterium]